jgi:Family of unknown function (DUF6282)
MRAIVLKSHSYPTAPCAHAARSLAPNVEVVSSVCLDIEAGGLNIHALECSAELGAKVAWIPTFSAANSIRKVSKSLGLDIKSDGLKVIAAEGRLLPEAAQIIAAIKKHDMVLATGHVTPAETFALMDECERIGLKKVIITHALERHVVEEALTRDQIVALARRGAYIKHCILCCLPAHRDIIHPSEMVEMIRATGPQQCVLGTDLGVAYHPSPAEGMRMFISTLLRHGMSEEDVRTMTHTNPAYLLGLDSPKDSA